MRQKIWFGYTGVQKIRKRAEPHERPARRKREY